MSEHRDNVDRLLSDGRCIERPSRELLELASDLSTRGLITTQLRQFVRCADPLNADRYAHNRACRGKVYVEDGLDAPGHEYRCPKCDRVVNPYRAGMNRTDELRTSVRPVGIVAYVRSRLNGAAEIGPGVFKWEHTGRPVWVCVGGVPFEFLAPQRCREHTTIRVVASLAEAAARRSPGERATVVTVADLLVGATTLAQVAQAISSQAATAHALATSGGTIDGNIRVEVKPNAITLGSHTHRCDLSAQLFKFISHCLPRDEIAFTELMHPQEGVVWRKLYTQAHRRDFRTIVFRANAALATADPVIPISFSVREGADSITRRIHASAV